MADDFALQLRERGEHGQDELTRRRSCVGHRLLQSPETNAAQTKLFDRQDDVRR